MRSWIERHALLAYYALALALSWGYWLTLLAQGARVAPGSGATHFPGLLGPAVAALFVTAAIGGRAALRELLERALLWPVPRGRALLLALSPLALGALAFAGLALLGQPLPTAASFARFPGLPEGWPLALLLLVVLVVNGYGEEMGWRGFATERLLMGRRPFAATLIVAALWAFWHLPLFWLNTSFTEFVGPTLVGWLIGLLCGAFVLADVYLRTGRSILAVALWHTLYNMMVAPEAGEGLPAAGVSTLVMVWGAVVALRWWRAERLSRPPSAQSAES